jgi:hypothetical protein
LAIGLASELNGQTTTSGGLVGVITDQSNAVVPDAGVELKDNAKGITQSTKTDRQGEYRFFFLAPARYLMTVTHDGFRKESRAVIVSLGPPATVNLALQIAKASSEMTVTDEAPLIHAENGDVSVTFSQGQISETPNPGNDLTYIAQTAPGAIMQTDFQAGANFSILGMSGMSYLYTIDGMNDNENSANFSQAGALFLLLGQNQIQEATVVSTGYSGQFGGAAGGNVNYITKSGGNQLHGNAQYYWNDRALNANNWFLNALGKPRPFDIANQWAGSIGGAIKKDKLFFFFDTEGLRVLIAPVNVVQIPSREFETATLANIDAKFGAASASDGFYKKIFNLYNSAPGASSAKAGTPTDRFDCGPFTEPNGLGTTAPCGDYFIVARGRPSQDALVSGRIDWNIVRNDRAFLRLQYDQGRGALYTDPISPAFDVDLKQPWWQAQAVETHTFSSTAASQFLAASSYFAPIIQVKNPMQTLSTFPTVLNPYIFGTFNALGPQDNWTVFGSGQYYTQYQLSEDVVKILGSHKLGFGGQFAQIFWNELPSRSASIGTLFPQTLNAFYNGGVGDNPSSDFTQLQQSFTSQGDLKLSFLSYALYGQEEWQARPGLTLTAALRAEHYSNPACRTRCFARLAGPFEVIGHDPNQPYDQAIFINQTHALEGVDSILWSPRVSFAWQPLGVRHSMVLRGGAGFFYDRVPGAIADAFDRNAPLLNSYTIVGDNLTPNESTSLFKDAAASNAAFLNGFASGQTLAQIQAAISRFYPSGFSPPGMSTATRTVHAPQFQRWSLELQEAIGATTSISVGYFGHHGIHELAQNPNANAFGFGSLPSGTCTSPPVPPCADARFRGVTQYNTNAVSNYHGVVVSFKRHISHWGEGTFEANYTYGHAFDEVSNGGILPFTTGGSIYPQDPNNLRGSYGPAEYDVRHSLNANYVWELPLKAALGGRGPNYLVNGWQISGTIFARTGLPYTVIDIAEANSLNGNNFFGTIYAVPVGPLPSALSCGKGAAVPPASHPCLPQQLKDDEITPNAQALFLQSGCETGFNAGTLGQSGLCNGPAVSFAQGRNRFRGPSYFNTDFAVIKNTKIPGWENASLGIGFQFFNFFNHPNFGFPDSWSSDPATSYGKIFYPQQPPTGILGAGFGADISPRMIQLKAQLRF